MVLSMFLFCQTRSDFGISGIFPVKDSTDFFNPGICSDISLTYYLCKYISVNGTFEIMTARVKTLNERATFLSAHTGLGFNYNINQFLQIRLTPNIGIAHIDYASFNDNKMRIGSEISLGNQLSKHLEMEQFISTCYFIYDKPFDQDLLDAIKTGLRIGYVF